MPFTGVWLRGFNSTVERLTVTQNGGEGIVVDEGIVSNNIVTYNQGVGIYGGVESGVMTEGKVYAVGNLLQSNAGGGVRAVVARDNVFHNNNGFGPQLLSGTLNAGGNICASGTC
jgi:hypothetical protein